MKFEVGDKVKANCSQFLWKLTQGEVYTVTYVNDIHETLVVEEINGYQLPFDCFYLVEKPLKLIFE